MLSRISGLYANAEGWVNRPFNKQNPAETRQMLAPLITAAGVRWTQPQA